MPKRFILASSSPYRLNLIKTLLPNVEAYTPDIDESTRQDEPPQTLVKRLAQAKAQAIIERVKPKNTIIIASDQVGIFNDKIIAKAYTKDRAFSQLQSFSGQCAKFITSLYLVDTESHHEFIDHAQFNVHFRNLSDQEILNYLAQEDVLNCAGSFKVEGLGISLFERLEGDDFNSLIGLPLIMLNNALINHFNINPLNSF
ncbi:nucleoside triphosphate pyrophosphatase [Cysteiniphilum sp. QT6929]|uniref:Maf family protein n=1 Tax=Cysteiniphilum sp. QT6929 TaxID=2975055 RepID=UPI0024B34B10|nr:nucleoside triphosphate pyrophosphatase [Cysteiniphilum sp. QT6929]WHN65719.1 Maf family nucleotide pyrophosphatase [Cysteiniphilum sp. QT6929]